MSVSGARRRKWEAGRRHYGPHFVGDPVEELFAEIVDALNYEEEARCQGHDTGDLKPRLEALAHQVQAIHGRREQPGVTMTLAAGGGR